jgi:FAD/FMN-containing dehydrogenase
MSELLITTREGTRAGISSGRIDTYADRLRGELILAGHPAYEQARRVWNGNIDRRPALIARCLGVADVMASVTFAREHDMLVAIRSGAHNAAGYSTCDGGLVIDLSQMKGIKVDPAKSIADAQAGLLWGEFDNETQAFGLATTGGVVSDTGIAGLTLGGGLGWLMGKHGLTIDNLLSVDLVTADGKFLTASADEHADLFWGLRGGGGNFGVVTSFRYRLHPVGPNVLGGMVVHPMARARDVLRFYRDFSADLPDEAEANAALATSPDGNPIAVLLLGYNGPIEEGEKVLAPARAFGEPIADLVQPMPYALRNTIQDEPNAIHGIQRYWKSGFTETISDDLIDLLVEAGSSFKSPLTGVAFFRVHGAATRVHADATAFGLRQEQWDFNVVSQWKEDRETDAQIAWTRELWSRIEPLISNSAYVNHLAGDDKPEKVRASFGDNYDRLSALKRQYDPMNFFRLNANIAPA